MNACRILQQQQQQQQQLTTTSRKALHSNTNVILRNVFVRHVHFIARRTCMLASLHSIHFSLHHHRHQVDLDKQE